MFYDNWKPNEVGFILVPNVLASCLATVPVYGFGGFEPETEVFHLVECRPGAVLEMPSDRVRYQINRTKVPWHLLLIQPFGVDVMHEKAKWRDHSPIWIARNGNDDSYAELLAEWWFSGLVQKKKRTPLPMLGAA